MYYNCVDCKKVFLFFFSCTPRLGEAEGSSAVTVCIWPHIHSKLRIIRTGSYWAASRERVGGSTRPAGYYEPQKTAIILQKLGKKKVVLNYPAVANGKSIKVLLTSQFELS